LLRIIGSQQIWISALRLLTPALALLQLEGTENVEIVIDGGEASKAANVLVLKNGATPAPVRLRL